MSDEPALKMYVWEAPNLRGGYYPGTVAVVAATAAAARKAVVEAVKQDNRKYGAEVVEKWVARAKKDIQPPPTVLRKHTPLFVQGSD